MTVHDDGKGEITGNSPFTDLMFPYKFGCDPDTKTGIAMGITSISQMRAEISAWIEEHPDDYYELSNYMTEVHRYVTKKEEQRLVSQVNSLSLGYGVFAQEASPKTFKEYRNELEDSLYTLSQTLKGSELSNDILVWLKKE